MRAITRHALTGVLLATAALGVAATARHFPATAGAEPRPAVVVTAEQSPTVEDTPPMLDRKGQDVRGNRSSARSTRPSGVSRAVLEARESALADQRSRIEKASQILLQQKIEREGYDPRTAKTPREIGRQIAANKFGWSGGQWQCYDKLIMSESRWVTTATNPTSGAYGIPQSLPGNKMATVGSDWRTNPATQIIWGLTYVKAVYGTPCGAWYFKQGHNWY